MDRRDGQGLSALTADSGVQLPSAVKAASDPRPWLTIQTVLYGNDPDEFLRNAESMARSVEIAQRDGLLSQFALHIGDSSSMSVIDQPHHQALNELFGPLWGSVSVDYFGENLGSAAGHNRLFQRLNSEFVIIANPDIVYAPTTISALLRRVNVSDTSAMVEARQIPIEHPKAFNLRTGTTGWATTACALIRRSVVVELEGFDSESFFLYCDDVDFSWRARIAGYQVIFEPAAVVFHDKRLDSTGHMVITEAEHYYSAEAGLLLPHKYSRPDLVREIREGLLASPHPNHQKAAAKYDERNAAGTLPEPIDADHRIAEFVGQYYTRHRY
jgi:GT2 family glycosyltransferase